MEDIYLDNAATTVVRSEVADAMRHSFTEAYGNPSSLHATGQKGKRVLEQSRSEIASIIQAEPKEVYFTSGGTESNNLAIKGFAYANHERGNHLITSSIEHHAVLNVFQELEKHGFEVTYLPVDRFGLVNPETVKDAIRTDTVLVSIMLANNEIGTLEPLKEITALTKERRIAMHTDAVQAVGKIPVSVADLGIDMLSLSGHKFHGPKGIGVLYKRDGIKLAPLFEGGHQERMLRPGTENVPGVVGLVTALRLAVRELDPEMARLSALRDRLESGILSRIRHVTVNGHLHRRVPNISSLNFAFLEGEALLLALDTKGIAVSTASACSAGSDEPSHVLKAIGLDSLTARGALRFSLSKNNTPEEIEYVIEVVADTVEQLRQLSPIRETG